jgi:hypothetical protein
MSIPGDGVASRICVSVVAALGLGFMSSVPVDAQGSAIIRKACEVEVIKKLEQQRDSGINFLIRPGPLPAPPSISQVELVSRCRSFILDTKTYHPACPCPL